MYEGDTFFHLTTQGRIGLIVLSIALSALMVWSYWKISSRFTLVVKLLLAFLFLWAFVWLSPQVYYQYYLLLIEGLPAQIVIQKPPSPATVLELASFTAQTSLSNHGKGILFWTLTLAGLIQYIKSKPD